MARYSHILSLGFGILLLILASCSQVAPEQQLTAYAEEYQLLGHYDEKNFDNITLRYVYDADKDTLLLFLNDAQQHEAYVLREASTSLIAFIESEGISQLQALQQSESPLLKAVKPALAQEFAAAFAPQQVASISTPQLQGRAAPDCSAESSFIRRLLCLLNQILNERVPEESTPPESTSTTGGISTGTSGSTSVEGTTTANTTGGTSAGTSSIGTSSGGTSSIGSAGGTSGGTSGGGSTASLRGTVWFDKNGNQQRDALEPPLADVTVFLDNNANNQHDPGEPNLVTNAQGEFIFEGLNKGGHYRVMQKLTLGWHNTVASQGSGAPSAFGLRIQNGQNARIQDYPYMLSLQGSTNNNRAVHHRCGATLISPKYALTAMHCTTGTASGGAVYNQQVRAGSSYHDQGGKRVTVVRTIKPDNSGPEYGNLAHDIAVLELSQPLYTIPRAFLPQTDSHAIDQAGVLTTLLGWGRLSANNQKKPRQLQKTQATLISEEEGWQKIESSFYTRLFLGDIRSRGGKVLFFIPRNSGVCVGDSGGPMLTQKQIGPQDIRLIQIGVSSFFGNKTFSTTQCTGPLPDGYTQVRAYLDFIHEHVPLETSKVISVTLHGDTNVSFGNFH